MTISTDLVNVLRSAPFGDDENAAASVTDRSDFIRVVAQARIRGNAMEIDALAAERVLRLIYGDESALVDGDEAAVVGVQLVLARALAGRFAAEHEDGDAYMSAVQLPAQQLLAAMASG